MLELEDAFEILACPETGARVSHTDEKTLAKLNEAIERGEVTYISGEQVEAPLEGALTPEEGDFVYPVRNGIPNFLPPDRIPLKD